MQRLWSKNYFIANSFWKFYEVESKEENLILIGMRQGAFTPCNFGIGFCQLNVFQNFQTFLEVKIDINQVNLTPYQAHWVL
jgi:hypothetical protein